MLRPLMIATVWPATGIVPARMAATGAAPPRGPGDAERVVTGRGGDYPVAVAGRGQGRQCAADLERAGRLEALQLQVDALTQAGAGCQRRGR